MSVTFTTSPDQRFRAGTVLYCYRATGQIPSGPPVAAATVQADSTATFTGLAGLARYLAGATTSGPFVSFTTDPEATTPSDQDDTAFNLPGLFQWAAMNPVSTLEGSVLVHPSTGIARYGTSLWPDGSLGTYIAKALSHSNTLTDAYTVSQRPFASPVGVTEWRPAEGFVPLGDEEAAAHITRVPEVRSAHTARNAYVPSDGELNAFYAARPNLNTDNTENPYNRLVTGRPGLTNPSTDDLIQWASWKWGIPTDRVRAQMVQESGWSMDFLGDLTTQPDEAHYLAAPEFARVPSTLNAYESLGISQLRWFPDKAGNSNPHPGTEPLRWQSTAFNLDYYGSVVRFYFDDPDGRRTNWGDGTYIAGQEWLSQGGWYLPYPWNNAGQQTYVAAVQARLAARGWLLAEFSDVTSGISLYTQATITRSENGSILVRPPVTKGAYVPPDPPGPPLNPEAAAGDGAVTLDWDTPASDGGAPIARYRMTNVEFGWSVDTDYEAQHPYTLSGLEQGVPVSFNIRAIGVTGEIGEPSEDTSQVTPMAPSEPGAPTGVTGTPGNNRVSLTWSAPASDGGSAITSYQVTPIISGVPQTPVDTGTGATSCAVTGLTNGTAYTFTVAAENTVGVGPDSTASSAITPVTPPGLEVPPETFLLSDGADCATSNEDFRPAANLTRPLVTAPGSLANLTWRSVTVPTTMAPQWGAVRLSADDADLTAVALNILSPGQPRFSPSGTLGNTGGAASNYTTLMRNYTILANPATGSCPADSDGDWVTLETVTDNRRASRLHLLSDLTGYTGGWLKVRVTESSGTSGNNDVAFRLEVHDAQDGFGSAIVGYGDSITMGSSGIGDEAGSPWSDGGLAQAIATETGRDRPIYNDYSTGGWTAALGDTNKEAYIGGMPHGILLLAFCHNDAHGANIDLNTVSPAGALSTYALSYKAHMQSIIDYAVGQGFERVIIPYGTYTTNGDFDEPNTVILNEIIDDLAEENEGVVQVGPDMHDPHIDLADGIHPDIPDGYLEHHGRWAAFFDDEVYS